MTLPRIIALYDAAGNMFCIIVYLLVCIHPSCSNDLINICVRVYVNALYSSVLYYAKYQPFFFKPIYLWIATKYEHSIHNN